MAATGATAKAVKRKRPERSLAEFLQYFHEMEITVELKTGRLFRGMLAASDDSMNLTLQDAVAVRGVKRPSSTTNSPPIGTAPTNVWSSLHIRGSTIRYIHFPDQADLSGIIKQGLERRRMAEQKYQRGRRK